ncbi:MAG: phosphatidylserine decarboxylase [Planctomycetes bacterium]|nr:phosphatidylserine decarboxylase [Planctomycetota bacterium]
MPTLRRIALTVLPKVLLSRLTGWLCSTPLPRRLRPVLYGWFARRYGAAVDEVDGELASFRSLQAFFRRPLRDGARPLGDTSLVWPCDGRIVSIGPITGGRLLQVKGRDYSLAELLGDAELAAELEGGQQATIYLAPGDYHRVHSPFAGRVEAVRALPGTLFPVNPPAVRCIDRLFARNSRHVFRCQTAEGTPAALVMVGAYNVGGTLVTVTGGDVARGQEVGQFGFGSTVVAVLGAGASTFAELPPEARVRMGQAATRGGSGQLP